MKPVIRTYGRYALQIFIALFCVWHVSAIAISSYASSLEETIPINVNMRLVNGGKCRSSSEQPKPGTEAFWVFLGLCSENPDETFEPSRPFRTYAYPVIRPYLSFTKLSQRWHMFAPGPPTYELIHLFEVEETDGSWRVFRAYAPESIEPDKRWYMLQISRELFTRPDMLPLVERVAKLECEYAGIAEGRNIRIRRRFYILPSDKNTLSPTWWQENWTKHWSDMIDMETTCEYIS